MATEKITKALKKALFRLEAMEEKQDLSILDREMIGKLLIEAYENLWTYEIEEEEHPGKNEHFQFAEDDAPKQQENSIEETQKSNSNSDNSKPKSVAPEQSAEDAPSEVTQEVKEQAVETPQPQETVSVNIKESVQIDTSSDIPDELKEIFAVKQSQELSERLSQLPIDDIWTAMGLNERIFTQNELFGGDHEVFKETVQQLNELPSFAEAKKFLAHGVAKENQWAEESRAKIAKNFIRLINRRY